MRILSVAYPQFPVNADSAGGAEQILHLLEGEIVAAGHESTVIAAEGSRVSGRLLATPGFRVGDDAEDRSSAQEFHQSIISEILKKQSFDVVHYHGLDVARYFCERSGPSIVTVHLPTSWYEESTFALAGATFVFVSHSQAPTQEAYVISNGIDVDRFARLPLPREHLLCVARICPEKGVHLALQAAHLAGEKLFVAGPVHPFASHQEYFAREVAPLLDDERIYVGPVGVEEKRRLLAGAKALLIPSVAAETSSLVAMEAAAAGIPAIAFRSGALPEIVEDGVTGYIVDDIEGMAAAITRCGGIASSTCQQVARARFDKSGMAARYMGLYEGLIAAGQ